MDVRDAETVRAHLLIGAFMVEGMETSMGMLSTVMLQLSQMLKLTKPAIEAFRALAFLIEEVSQKQIAGMITDHIEKLLDTMLGRVKTTLEEVMSDLSSAAISATNTMDEFCDECHKLTEELTEVAEAVAETVGAVPILQSIRDEGPVPGRGGTYVDMAKKMVPPMHADMIVRGEMQKQWVQLVKPAGLKVDGVVELTEKQLVEKANVALDLMGLQAEDKPDGTRFVGATKLRGAAGGAMYEMNSEEVVDWLKEGDVMKAFIAKMGSTADYKAQTYEVVMDWVPVTFDPQQIGALEMVEQSSGLQTEQSPRQGGSNRYL
ncbi:hypothetical protein L208DRAFT_1274819 [Tricholoma matsutake]|nr:hypothetical protein L208DRAFT_1274819 [Tricholoma matsutake 945]